MSLRSRHEQLNSSIARYESKVSRQMAQLAKMNKHKDSDGDFDDGDDKSLGDEDVNAVGGEILHVTEEDIRREDDEIRELERKKRQLEERVKEMERDLGGLMR